MSKIEDVISRLQPEFAIQSLLEELVVALLSDLSLNRAVVTLYLPSLNQVQAEAVKRDNGEIVKSFGMTVKETPREVEEGMSTLEIPDKDEVLGRVYLMRDKAKKPWDFSLFVPYLEVMKLVLFRAKVVWEQKEGLDKIAELLGREERDQVKKREDEEVIKKLESQVAKSEEGIRERDREFLTLFHLSRDGLFIIDPGGHYLDVNHSACELLGYSKDELLIMNAFDPYPKEGGICWKVGLGTERCEISNHAGKTITVEITLTPFRYQGRDCFLGSMKRINRYEEPKREEEKREELSLDLLEDLNDAAVVMDEDGIIQYFNRRAEKLFGYAREKIVGKSLTRLMPERYREFHFNALKRLMKGGEPRLLEEQIEAEGLKSDGLEFSLEFSITPIKVHGKQLYLSILRDVSKNRIQ